MNKDKLFLYLFALSLFLYFVHPVQELRYFYYILPIVALIFYTAPMVKEAGDLLSFFNRYKILFLLNGFIVLFSGLYIKYFQESYLLLGAIFFAYSFYNLAPENINRHINVILYVSIVSFILQESGSVLSVITNPRAIVGAFLSSDISSESSTAFCFVILGFYFFARKRFGYFFIALIFLFLSFKRIAIGALVIGIVLYYLLNVINFQRIKKTLVLIPVIANIVYINLVILLSNGFFDAYIKKQLGVSSNFLFQGRVVLYKKVLKQVTEYSLVGNGIGKIAQLLLDTQPTNQVSLVNLHSDILKYFLELGIIGFLFFIFWFYKILATNKAAYSLCAVINIIFLTDNISIYLPIMVIFFLVISKLKTT
jgi:O-antigen ligase